MSKRVRINQYKASKSARELANYLSITRLKTRGSRFRGHSGDVVINWGNGKGNIGNARQINNLQNVQLASNKKATLQSLTMAEISVPRFQGGEAILSIGKKYLARANLYGHSGEGIEVFTAGVDDRPRASLYVEYIPKVAEYRVIVVGDEAVDVKKKLKRRPQSDDNPDGHVGEHNEHVWNLDGGYVMARQGFSIPEGLKQIGIDSIKALGLDFGAVDIIEDADGTLYVLEVNTAFGLEGQTISLVGDAIRRLL